MSNAKGRFSSMCSARMGWLAVLGVVVASCASQTPPSDVYGDEWPMRLTFSDGDAHGAEGVLDVYTDTSPPTFVLHVLASTNGHELAPTVQSNIAPVDVARITRQAASGGVDVPYGDASVVFSYDIDGQRIYRRPESLRMTIVDATVHIHIHMGEAVPYDGPVPAGLAPSASAELVGHLAVGCSVPDPESGQGFIQGDPTWSSAGCSAASRDYGLGVLRDLE
jgi:hypothetical protein